LNFVPTLSIGIAWHAPPMTPEKLYEKADKAMYQAKKMGKGAHIVLE
jgi:PleD family two-component response regulator